MKIRLAFILSALMMFSSLQDGMSQVKSIIFSTDSCCSTMSSSTKEVDCASAIDISEEDSPQTCCEGAECDCTCCIHISLFNTNFSNYSFCGEAEKDIYNYVDANSHPLPFPIFHPPHSFI